MAPLPELFTWLQNDKRRNAITENLVFTEKRLNWAAQTVSDPENPPVEAFNDYIVSPNALVTHLKKTHPQAGWWLNREWPSEQDLRDVSETAFKAGRRSLAAEHIAACDASLGHPRDPLLPEHVQGRSDKEINVHLTKEEVIPCIRAAEYHPNSVRSLYHLGRAIDIYHNRVEEAAKSDAFDVAKWIKIGQKYGSNSRGMVLHTAAIQEQRDRIERLSKAIESGVYLIDAAESGYPIAQYDLAVKVDDPKRKLELYTSAASGGVEGAAAEAAKIRATMPIRNMRPTWAVYSVWSAPR